MPPLTRTNLAGDDLSIWEHVAAGLASHGVPAAVMEPEAVAQVVVPDRAARSVEARTAIP